MGVSLIPSPSVTYRAPEPEVEPQVVAVLELTIDQQIHSNSLKMGLDEVLVRNIIDCEGRVYGNSTHRNVDKQGIFWSTDWGPLQVNDFYHKKDMQKLGLDIYNESDSLYYGMKMMKEQGTKPWSASKSCWARKMG